MQITGRLQIRAQTGEALLVACLDDQIARVQALSDAGNQPGRALMLVTVAGQCHFSGQAAS